MRRQLSSAGLLRSLSGLVQEYNNNNNNTSKSDASELLPNDLSKLDADKKTVSATAGGPDDSDCEEVDGDMGGMMYDECDDDDDDDDEDFDNDQENNFGANQSINTTTSAHHQFLANELLLKSAAAAAMQAAMTGGTAFPGLGPAGNNNSKALIPFIPPVSPPCSPPSPSAGGGNGQGGMSTNPNAKYSRCPICKKKLQNVRRHINEVHVGVTYTCEYCSRPFKRTDKLNNHILKEHRHLAPPQITGPPLAGPPVGGGGQLSLGPPPLPPAQSATAPSPPL